MKVMASIKQKQESNHKKELSQDTHPDNFIICNRGGVEHGS